jgi:hypothetical protein
MKQVLQPETKPRNPRKSTLAGMVTLTTILAVTFSAPYLSAGKNKKDKNKSPNTAQTLPFQELSEDQAILQALNRLGFGPRPGDLERVKEMGLQRWVDRQLHPESIDDSALEARLNRFPTLKMSSANLLREFPAPQAAARREGVSVEEYRKERQAQVRDAKQSMQDQDDEVSGQLRELARTGPRRHGRGGQSG